VRASPAVASAGVRAAGGKGGRGARRTKGTRRLTGTRRRRKKKKPSVVWTPPNGACGVASGVTGTALDPGTPLVPSSRGVASGPNAGGRTRGVDGVQGVARGFMPGLVGVGVNGTATASWWASRTSSCLVGEVSSEPGSSSICTSMAAASLAPRALGLGRGMRCALRCIAATRDTPRTGREMVHAAAPPRLSQKAKSFSWLRSSVVDVNFSHSPLASLRLLKALSCWHRRDRVTDERAVVFRRPSWRPSRRT
jgi:hypothetical protein